MRVPYQLRPREQREPAAALLVPGRDAGDVLRLCARLGLDPLPPIHATADGFLVVLPAPREETPAGVIRLRGLTPRLLLPIDAELVPLLLPDEAAALVKQRGLVFLPGNRVLEFAPDEPLPLAALLRLDDLARPDWQPLPAPPPLAQELHEIALAGDPGLPDELLAAGGQGIGDERPQFDDPSLPAKALGHTLYGLGKGMAWLGNSLGLRPAAGLGAKLLSAALEQMPGLSEKLMGAQEALLRKLLQELREGNVEKALKHAMPLGGDNLRGGAPATNARLPTHNLFYSLLDLLGGPGGGPASFWFSKDNTYHELAAEYRKQAELAARKGDHRRAAFIYARLLHDYRSAALVLSQGGLHRDAATLYEKKLYDDRAAAREWEAAGEVERAVRLCHKLGDHALAGDVLRRAGEEERAVAEYELAAARTVGSGERYYDAGELLRTRGQRPDLALPYYRLGWERRQDAAAACALRLAQHHAGTGEPEPLLNLIDEADGFLETWDDESAATFYNEVTRLAGQPTLRSHADELRDRARLGLARKLRQGAARRGNLLGTLFPAGSPWAAPIVRDAQYALKDASRRGMPTRDPWSVRRLRPSMVTAAYQMPVSKEVFLGLESGEVLCYRPDTGSVMTVCRERGPILGLSGNGDERYLLILSEFGPAKVCLAVTSRDTGFRMTNYVLVASEQATLTTAMVNQTADLVGLCVDRSVQLYRVPELVCQQTVNTAASEPPPCAAVFGLTKGDELRGWLLSFFPSNNEVDYYPDLVSSEVWLYWLGWALPLPGGSSLRQPLLHAAFDGATAQLEVTGIDALGNLCQSRIWLLRRTVVDSATHAAQEDQPYRAFAPVRSGLLAGVTRRGIDWLQPRQKKHTRLELDNPVAAFVLPAVNELLIVEADCSLLRVPVVE